MSVPKSPSSPQWLSELEAILEQLQDETMRFSLAGMAIGAMAILGSTTLFTNAYWNFWMLVALVGLIAAIWSIRRRSLTAASWLLVLGSLLAIVLTVIQNALWPIIWLVLLPVGLATLIMGTAAGAALAAACSVLLWLAPGNILQVPPLVRAITAIGMWSTVGMIWLTLRPLMRAVEWAWSGYERNREIMEQMRDTQVRLQETLEDLTNANVLLTRMTQQAEAMRQIAEVERQAKERFVANVSHELRTPLNMIIGFCEMITQEPDNYGGDIPPALLADLAVVLRNSQHLSSLINDVLDLSQLDAGRTALSRERTSLADIIEAAVQAVRPLYDSKGLFLKTLVSDGLPLVFCDRTRIREVVLNLLSNAGRFTAQGGVTVRAWQEGHEALVSVEDTGPGISKENLEKLFQPFQQLENSIRRDFGGTGLGLSISKGFVELHGGQMKVESQVGMGTTFFFRLPIDPPVALPSNALRWFGPYQTFEPRTRPTRLSPVTILPRLVVVEKGKALENLLSRYMHDVEITAVESLEQASAELERSPAQALLLNHLQVNEGFARLQSGCRLPAGLPAIICSLPGVEQAAGSLGVADYLLKPVSQETLYAAIDRLERPVKTVLVVDNEPDALQLFARMLTAEGRGYTVLRVSNGQEALDLLHYQQPDLILCDLMMPEMDGFQFLALKSQNPAWQAIPVILVSARDPLGQPIVSNALLVTSRDGLSVSQLLTSIEALISILSRGAPSGDLAQPVASPG